MIDIKTALFFGIILLIIHYLIKPQLSNKIKEKFYTYWRYPYYYPFWNYSSRSTRNMSYDLRGDIPIPPNTSLSPWLNSSLAPIYNKPLWMVS